MASRRRPDPLQQTSPTSRLPAILMSSPWRGGFTRTQALKHIAAQVMQLRLFSPNEELDDISTTDLKYLLVPYMLAEVVAATREMEKRLPSLREALLFWRAFAADCQRLGVGHDDDYAAVDREQEPSDPASKREEKIARYKRCKELDQKVSYLFGQKREDLGDEYLWGAGSSFDEDMERELILMLLRRAVASDARQCRGD
eukprot:g12503.t1